MKAVVMKINHGHFELELEGTRLSVIHVHVTRTMIGSVNFLMIIDGFATCLGFHTKEVVNASYMVIFSTTVTGSRREKKKLIRIAKMENVSHRTTC